MWRFGRIPQDHRKCDGIVYATRIAHLLIRVAFLLPCFTVYVLGRTADDHVSLGRHADIAVLSARADRIDEVSVGTGRIRMDYLL